MFDDTPLEGGADAPPFSLLGPWDGSSSILLSSPHSGRIYPAAFLEQSRLSVPALRRLEDAHVGDLLHPSVESGLPLIEANYGRAMLDLNRDITEYDSGMIRGHLPFEAQVDERVKRGFGLFPRIAGNGLPIYMRKMPAELALARIERIHQPYHQKIATALDLARQQHGYAVLLDIHSMPSIAQIKAPQLVLGDRFGTSASSALVDWLHQAFQDQGLRVVRNIPYAGGYTTRHHGQPKSGIHAIQLEFDRALYMDPASLQPLPGFHDLGLLIEKVLNRFRTEVGVLLTKAL